MKIGIEDIELISKLMKLNFNKKEEENLVKEFNEILSDFDKIENVDIFYEEDEKINKTVFVLKKDEVKNFTDKEVLFQNTKNIKNGHIILPKIIEEWWGEYWGNEDCRYTKGI